MFDEDENDEEDGDCSEPPERPLFTYLALEKPACSSSSSSSRSRTRQGTCNNTTGRKQPLLHCQTVSIPLVGSDYVNSWHSWSARLFKSFGYCLDEFMVE
jgi:hypothetical protein